MTDPNRDEDIDRKAEAAPKILGVPMVHARRALYQLYFARVFVEFEGPLGDDDKPSAPLFTWRVGSSGATYARTRTDAITAIERELLAIRDAIPARATEEAANRCAADSVIEKLASFQDARELNARSAGAYDAAVCYQQYAEWIRCGTPIKAIRGTPAKTLSAEWDNGMVMLAGDALDEPEALGDIVNVLTEEAAGKADHADAWERGYESGYDDREKMDHDRAYVVKTENPYHAEHAKECRELIATVREGLPCPFSFQPSESEHAARVHEVMAAREALDKLAAKLGVKP